MAQRGRPRIFDDVMVLATIRIPKPMRDVIRNLGGGSFTAGIIFLYEVYTKQAYPKRAFKLLDNIHT